MRSAIFAWIVACLLVMASVQATEPSAPLRQAHDSQAGVTDVRAGSTDETTHGAPRCPSTTRGGKTPLLCSLYLTGSTVLTLDARTGRVFVARERGDIGYVSVFNAHSGALLRTVMVGEFPLSIADDAGTGHVFVGNAGTNSVSMLDARTGAVLRTVHIATDPVILALAERAGRVFTTGAHGGIVSAIDARTGRVVASVSLPHGPFSALAVAERASRVFLTGMFTSSLIMFDARSGRVLRTVPGVFGALVVGEHSERVYTGAGVVLDARSGAALHLRMARGGDRLALDTPRRRVIGITSVSVDISDADSGHLLHSASVSIDNQPASAPVVIERTGHILVLLSSPTDDDGNYVGPGYLLVVDERSGAVVRRINANGESMGTYGPSDSIVVDSKTNRVFVLDDHGLDVFDAARL